jgi:hypothetical protein
MTITNGLITAAEYGAYVGVTPPSDPGRSAQWDDAITVASRWVEKRCGRQFHDSGAIGSARYFDPVGKIVPIDDCRSITQVAVDTNDDGTHITVTTDYQALPPYGRDPRLGAVPYTELLGLSLTTWKYDLDRLGSVKVTGLWGWSSVPDDVKRATAILAQDLLRDPESQFGGLAVAGEGIVLGARIPARVLGLLDPWVRHDRVLGIA